MSKAYLTPDHPDAFVDWEKIDPGIGLMKNCPVCKCYGGWNLAINQYTLPPGMDNTPENRHRHVHFRTMCSHCNGHGYVHPSVTCSGHQWVFEKNLGRCYNRYRCRECNAVSDVDSSD